MQSTVQCRKPKSLLIFPPGWTAYAPYLALPALAAVARRDGFQVDLSDLNVEYYDSALSKEVVNRNADACRLLLPNAKDWWRQRTLTAAIAYSGVAERVEEVKSELRDRGRQFNSRSIRAHLETLTKALYVVAAPVRGFKLLLNRFELPINIESLADVSLGLHDPSRNPFLPFLQSAIPKIVESKYDFIGISITSETQLVPGLTLLSLLRDAVGPGLHICLGGNFITRLLKLSQKHFPVLHKASSIVCDEGEAPFVSILNALAAGGALAHIAGIAISDGTTFQINASEQQDVAQLPTPDFKGLPLEKYFSPELILPVYTSRSCFAKCTFCAIPAASGVTFRVRAADSVAQDCKTLSDAHGANHFTFVDETLVPGMMKKISEEFIRTGVSYRWYGETRFGPQFTDAFAEKIYSGGCRKLQFGLESYNQRVLDLMRKNVKLEHIEPALQSLFKHGIAAHLFFMVGFPTETEQEARNTDTFTRRMLNESRVRFGNPFTTRGFDVFGLDPLAPVYAEPEYHRIELKKTVADDEVSFRIGYESREGLSAEQARLLVEEFRSGLVPLLRTAQRRPPGDFLVEDAEELNFLGACALSDDREMSVERRDSYDSLIVTEHCFHGFADNVLIFRNMDLLAVNESIGTSNLHSLYSPVSGMWLTLTNEELDEATAGSMEGFMSILLQSLQFGKMHLSKASVTEIRHAYPVSFLDRCTYTDVPGGVAVVVLVHGTGRVVSVGLLTFLALRMSNGFRTLYEIIKEVETCIGPDSGLPIESISADFTELSHLGVVAFSKNPVGEFATLQEI